MAVFPEAMNRLNTDDPKSALEEVQRYINYMVERMEFSMGNLGRTVSGSGTTTIELVILIEALTSEVAALTSKVGALTGEVNGVQESIGKINESIKGINETLKTLDERVTKLENPQKG